MRIRHLLAGFLVVLPFSPPTAAVTITIHSGKDLATVGPLLFGTSLRANDESGGPIEATIELKNSHGLRWQLEKRGGRWTLGTLFVHDKPVDAPLASGIVALSNINSGRVCWPAATNARQLDERSARFTGSEKIGDVLFRFEMDAALREDVPAATLVPRWSVDKELDGYDVCLAYQGRGTTTGACRAIPSPATATGLRSAPMRYCGVPGVLVYRPDLSMVVLFAMDMQFDYLDPATWTGKTGFHFVNRQTAPQFRCGGGKLSAGVRYEHSVNCSVERHRGVCHGDPGIMESWIKVNNYQVDESLAVRTPQEASRLGWKAGGRWPVGKPGIGYEHHRARLSCTSATIPTSPTANTASTK